jgi:hypothetical protein
MTTADQKLLLALGTMLAEMAFGMSLEERRVAVRLPPTSPPNDLANAHVVSGWISDLGEQLTVEYERAIMFCLQQSLDGKVRLEDERFRGRVIEHVLAPLQEELRVAGQTPRYRPA